MKRKYANCGCICHESKKQEICYNCADTYHEPVVKQSAYEKRKVKLVCLQCGFKNQYESDMLQHFKIHV